MKTPSKVFLTVLLSIVYGFIMLFPLTLKAVMNISGQEVKWNSLIFGGIFITAVFVGFLVMIWRYWR